MELLANNKVGDDVLRNLPMGRHRPMIVEPDRPAGDGEVRLWAGSALRHEPSPQIEQLERESPRRVI
jgi:hypothetical protein